MSGICAGSLKTRFVWLGYFSLDLETALLMSSYSIIESLVVELAV